MNKSCLVSFIYIDVKVILQTHVYFHVKLLVRKSD